MNDQSHLFGLLEGVHLGKITGFSDDNLPIVEVGGAKRDARALVALDAEAVGCEVAVVALAGGDQTLLVLGLVDAPMRKKAVVEAGKELVLRCGKSSVTLGADGRVSIKGKQLLSRAEGQNRVQGANVALN